MKIPKLVSLTSNDLARDQLPLDPTDCELTFTASIGCDGVSGDNFQFVVVTPSALAKSQYTGWCKDYLLIQDFSWAQVDNYVANLLASVRGESWAEIAEQLHQFMDWEFYNYRPSL
jgi:Immunity protein 8